MPKFLRISLAVLMLIAVSSHAKAQCEAKFTFTSTCDTVMFTDSSSWKGRFVEHNWNFGDGTLSTLYVVKPK
jgi:hypothetical protein